MKLTSSFISDLLDAKYFGKSDAIVSQIVSLGDGALTMNMLTWCSDKNIDQLKNEQEGCIILSSNAHETLKNQIAKNINFFVVEHPRKSFAQLMKFIASENQSNPVIHQSASIDGAVVTAEKKCSIGANVVIEKNVELGLNVKIGANSVILSGTVIRDNVTIGCNCTIGGVGFGYELGEDNSYELIHHIGNVVLEKNVDIGNNVCIDRAVLGSTHIGENVKIDNLVHVAHGVKIGKNSLIIASAMIAGSATIGKNVWISPSSSIKQKIKIGDNALVGMGSVVLKDVDAKSVVAGVPAKKIKDND